MLPTSSLGVILWRAFEVYGVNGKLCLGSSNPFKTRRKLQRSGALLYAEKSRAAIIRSLMSAMFLRRIPAVRRQDRTPVSLQTPACNNMIHTQPILFCLSLGLANHSREDPVEHLLCDVLLADLTPTNIINNT